MSTEDLPTIGELVADASRSLAEPFSRAALIAWVSARRPDVGVSSISSAIQGVTDGHQPPGRAPLLVRVERGRYRRYRPGFEDAAPLHETGRVVLVGSSGESAAEPRPARELFRSPGFARARDSAAGRALPWFVLSARHGLLDPDEVAAPSAVLLGDQPAGFRSAWAEWVVVQLADRVRLAGATVEVHGGVDFAQALKAPLERRGARVEIPLPGAWDDAPPHRPPHDDDPAPAVRVALDRLRSLVHRR